MKKETAKAKPEQPHLVPKRTDTAGKVLLPISNLPRLDDTYDGGLPAVRDLENFRLRNQVRQLDRYARQLNDRINFLLGVLGEDSRLWQNGLQHDQWPTLGQALKLLGRIEAAMKYEGNAPADKEMEDAMQKFVDRGREAKARKLLLRRNRAVEDLRRIDIKLAKLPVSSRPTPQSLERFKARCGNIEMEMKLVGLEFDDILKEAKALNEQAQ